MSIVCIAPFDVQHLSGSIVRIDVSNSITNNAYIRTTGTFFTSLSASIEGVTYNHFGNDFTSWLQSNGFGRWSFTYSMPNTQLIINCESGSGAKFVFTSSDNGNAAKIFGMSNGITTGQTQYVSANRPYFYWVSTEKEWSKISQPYEGEPNLVRFAACDDGRTYMLSKEDSVYWLSNTPGNYTWMDWKFVYEQQANIFNDYSSSFVPYTWQTHLQWVRSYKPFVVFEFNTSSNPSYDVRQGTYKIRAAESKFDPDVSFDSLYSYWDINVKTRQLSVGTNFGLNTITNSFTALTSPLQINGAVVWLRSDLGVVTNSSNQVLTWSNQVVGQPNFTTSVTLNNAPAYVASSSVYKGNPSILFFSNSLGMKGLASTAGIQYLSPALTNFIVFAKVNTGGSMYLLETSTNASGASGSYSNIINSGGQFRLSYVPAVVNADTWLESSGITSSRLNMAAYRMKTYQTASWVYDYVGFYNYSTASSGFSPALSSSYGNQIVYNNIGSFSATSSLPGYLQSQNMFIGSENMGTFGYLSGSIAEIISYNRALTDPEIQQVQNYLLARYT